ncbi:MAG: zf-HC2 domain-containing protein [Anaerolineales bacterium]|nr:zf-HC2 domain-containing protein [Anaerolineales bacterium]
MTESTHSNCASLLGSLSDYIDGELGAELCRQIEKHIAECEDCRIVVDTTRKTIDLVHASKSCKRICQPMCVTVSSSALNLMII